MAGRKFGSTGSEEETWASNVLCPALVADSLRNSKLVVFSTDYDKWKDAGSSAGEIFSITCLSER